MVRPNIMFAEKAPDRTGRHHARGLQPAPALPTCASMGTRIEDDILGGAERDAVRQSRHPELQTLEREAVLALARRLREYRDKARTIAADRRRAHRGKAAPRGAGPAPAEEGVLLKKQAFAAALKRVNSRIAALQGNDRRARTTDTLRAALARKKAAPRHHPSGGATAGRGMQALDEKRQMTDVNPGQVGSVSQQVKNNQAARDSR
jgi:hypothetical protein